MLNQVSVLQNGTIYEIAAEAAEKERRKEVLAYYLRFEAQQRSKLKDWDVDSIGYLPTHVATLLYDTKMNGERMEERRKAYLRKKKSERTLGTLVVVLPSIFKVQLPSFLD